MTNKNTYVSSVTLVENFLIVISLFRFSMDTLVYQRMTSITFRLHFKKKYSEAFSEPSPVSKIELLVKIVNSIKALSFPKAGPTLNVFQSSEHASEYVPDILEKMKEFVFDF